MALNLKKCKLPQYTVVLHPHIKSEEHIKLLAKDFKAYKNNITPNFPLFGRDAPFTDNPHLKASNIHKVHIIDEGEYKKWKTQYENTSDLAHLVYCIHIDDPNKLCVIDFLSPTAHKQARSVGNINRMIERAESFMSAYKITKSA
jgi:hypothetical protein